MSKRKCTSGVVVKNPTGGPMDFAKMCGSDCARMWDLKLCTSIEMSKKDDGTWKVGLWYSTGQSTLVVQSKDVAVSICTMWAYSRTGRSVIVRYDTEGAIQMDIYDSKK